MSNEKSKIGWVMQVVAPPLVIASGVAGYVALAAQREMPRPNEIEQVVPKVEVLPVSESGGVLDISADGVVVPHRSIEIAAEVDGRIVEKTDLCRAGRMVSEGDLLLRIDPASFELEVERLTQERGQAEASVRELQVEIENKNASIALAEDEHELRQADLRRVENLQDRGVSTQQSLDAARVAVLSSRKALVLLQNEKRTFEAQRTRLEQAIKLAEARLAEAQLNLERTVIRSPGHGVIVGTSVEQGGYVRAGNTVLEFEDTSAVEVKTNLEMRTLAWLRGQTPGRDGAHGPYDLPQVPVTVLFEVLGNVYSWTGELERVDGVGVDARTRTIPCRVLVRDPRSVTMRSGSAELPVSGPPALVRGMFVKLLLHSRPLEPLLSVPEVAVRPDNTVWTVRDGKLERVELAGARKFRGEVLVSSQVTGLRAGEDVVVSPLPLGRQGMEVNAVAATLAVEGRRLSEAATEGESDVENTGEWNVEGTPDFSDARAARSVSERKAEKHGATR